VLFALAGLGAVALAGRHLSHSLRGTHAVSARARRELQAARCRCGAGGRHRDRGPSLAALGMQTRDPRLREPGLDDRALRAAQTWPTRPACTSSIPVILLQVIEQSYYATRRLGDPAPPSPRVCSPRSASIPLTLTTCSCSCSTPPSPSTGRRTSGLYPIYASTPIHHRGHLFGKSVANCLVAVVLMAAAWLGCAIILLVQGKVGMQLRPFLVVWGLLLVS
jgi:hypothetical protein